MKNEHPSEVIAAIHDVKRHPGFAALEERFNESVQRLTDKVMDAGTPNEEANTLRRAIAELKRLSPERLSKTILNTEKPRAKKEYQ